MMSLDKHSASKYFTMIINKNFIRLQAKIIILDMPSIICDFLNMADIEFHSLRLC